MPPQQNRLCGCGCGRTVAPSTEYRHLRKSLAAQVVKSAKSRVKAVFQSARSKTSNTPTKRGSNAAEVAHANVPGPLEEADDTNMSMDLDIDVNQDINNFPQESFAMEDAPPATPPPVSESENNPPKPTIPQARRSSRLAAISQQRWGSTPRTSDIHEVYNRVDEAEPVEEDPGSEELDGGDDDDSDDETFYEGSRAAKLISENFAKEFALTQNNTLEESDISLLRAYILKTEESLTNRTYEKFRYAFPEAALGTIKETESRVQYLSGIQPIRFDCCQSSCICYTGPYEDLQCCPTCKRDRFGTDGRPRAYFEYYPIIPRLQAMAADPASATRMQYRSTYENDPGNVGDIFDGSHYCSLKNTQVTIGDETLPFQYFSDPRDVALGLSTDGFGPFRQRTKTSWPIILFNYNLPPEERFLRKNIIAVGVIPGPKKPADMDSFLWPLVGELVDLLYGVGAFDVLTQSAFELYAYLVLGFGDIPAISLVMRMKGQNALVPCRLCEIRGIRGPDSKTLYVPLHRENFPDPSEATSYNPEALPIRTHDRFLQQASEIENANTVTESERLQTQFGIKGTPLLSSLRSLSFPLSFPYDFMHLIWANLLPNLILLWTASFKDVNHQSQPYVIEKTVWEAIGAAGTAAGKTIPAVFGCRVPDLSNEKAQVTCEAYSIWTFYLAPTLLRGRFSNPQYYHHFVELVRLLNVCLKYNLTSAEVNQLEVGFVQWVRDYERLYYQHKPERVSCCPLTVHALLHIAPSIRAVGPVWAYWAFPMERFCNELLPHIKSRQYPYKSINKYVGSRAHISQIKSLYNLHGKLTLLPPPSREHEFTQPEYPDWAFLYPVRTEVPLPQGLRQKLIATLATRYETTYTLINRLLPSSSAFTVCLYGRARRANGDTIHAREMVTDRPDSRDMTFVRYELEVDKFARQRRRNPEYEKQTFFGQAKYFFVMEMPASSSLKIQKETLMYAAIRQVAITETLPPPHQISYYEHESGPLDIVDINHICGVVGRIRVDNRWAIVDRENSVARIHIS